VGVAPVQSLNTSAANAGYAFVGSTNTASVTIQNVGNGNLSGAGAISNLNGTIASGSRAFSLTGGTAISLTDGASQTFNYTYTPTQFGPTSVNLSASFSNGSADGTNSANTQSFTLTGTALDHSNASLSSTANQTTETIDFGNVLRGATVPSQGFTIYNRAANTSAAYTANLKLTGFTATGDAALTTTLSTFGNLTPGNGNTYVASLNTANYTTTGSNTVTMAASQLVDDSTLSGSGGNNNGAVTIVLQGNVGNATADKSNSQGSFGSPLTATVGQNTSYTGLESTVTATSGSGGYGMVGSTATILAGTNTSGESETVSMAWRTQTQAERASPGLISDIVCLGGMAPSGDEISPFVLQMTYDPALLPLGAGSEGLWASDERIYLAYLDPSDDKWENAIDGNIGGNTGGFQLGAWAAGDMTVGDWGVNTADHTVWAVVDYDGTFAVVPEPSTFALLAAGAVGLVGWAWRRRGAKA
jgi:hypothetical protein